MLSTWSAEKFPRYEQSVRNLTLQNRALKDEPLYRALCYGAIRAPHDIFLLAVIGNGVTETVSAERELYETIFSPTPGFPMDLDQRATAMTSSGSLVSSCVCRAHKATSPSSNICVGCSTPPLAPAYVPWMRS